MKPICSRQQRGFGLIDAAIAAVVLGVGVLGLTALNGTLLQGTGQAKARAEAVQRAETYFEQARQVGAEKGCTTLPQVPSTVTGVNASYSISTSYMDPEDPTGTPDFNEEVKMVVQFAWNDGADANQMVLTTVVNCREATTTDSGLGESAPGLLPDIKTPTGRGEVGGPDDQYQPFPAELTEENTIGENGPGDGTYTYVNEGRVELLEKTYDTEGNVTGGQVLLGFDQLCEDEDFSTVSGKLFIAVKNGDPIVAESDLFLLSSDASYCAVLPYSSGGVLPTGATGNDVDYIYIDYQCYFAPEWWGNVGVVRTGTVNTNDRVCVGNPNPAIDVETAFSKDPQLSTTRGYRAYREIGTSGLYESVGIGFVDTDEGDDDACDYAAVDFTDHHFVLANLTGGSTCETEELAVEALDGSALGDNPGRYFCMDDDPDGVDCLYSPGTIQVPDTTLHGTITMVLPDWATAGTDWPVLTGIDQTGGPQGTGESCETTAWIDNQNDAEGDGSNTYSYTCEIDWTGFTGNSWFGDIFFDFPTGETITDGTGVERNTTATLCMVEPTESNPTVTPVGESVAYVINDRFAEDLANTISFTNIPRTVTDVELDFNVTLDWCGNLGTPNVSWLQTENATLIWPAVFRADSYLIQGCVVDNTNGDDLTPCTPSTDLVPSQTNLGYDVAGTGNLNNNDTYCIQVTAMASGYDNSSPSPVKCVSRSGGTYYYQ